MRNAFCAQLVDLACLDQRIVLLTADLGFRVLEPFAERHPTRFFNVGVAEQNMIGVATGLAEAGFIPFVYSISTFAAMRAYEFIRNGPVLHRLPIRIIGIGGGFDYGPNGASHHALEDLGLLRLQPDLTVIVPADDLQARNALSSTWTDPRPIYYRLAKDSRSNLPGLGGRFALNEITVLSPGVDVLIIALGPAAFEAIAAAERLRDHDISAQVAVCSSLSFDVPQHWPKVLSAFSVVVTVEEHYVTGGLGTQVSEAVAGANLRCQVVRCGVKSGPDGVSGSARFLNREAGLDAVGIATAVRAAVSVEKTRS